jgi:hypothetical protein
VPKNDLFQVIDEYEADSFLFDPDYLGIQVTDAFPWDEAPSHLVRDRDEAFGPAYTHRIRAMGIRDHPTAPRDEVASRSEELRFLLQPGPDASLIGQECAGLSAPAEARPHRSHLNSGRSASPICQGLGFG